MKASSSEKMASEQDRRTANAKRLAAGYTWKKRSMEWAYLSASTLLWCHHLILVGRYFVHSLDAHWMQLLWMPIYAVAAMALADLISGFVHWGLDTWGTPDTLVFGSFIRSFREHHVNQTAMCHHDFVETNADTTLPLLPFLLWQHYSLSRPNESGNGQPWNLHAGNVGSHVFLLTLMLFVAITNEIHKWSHQVRQSFLVRKAMDHGLLLSPIAHRKHHKDPFDCSYCITTGWLNPLLDAVDFWRHMESLVTKLTGAIPRLNDQTLLGK